MKTRRKTTFVECKAGCFVCGEGQGTLEMWTGPTAMMVAAKHHDKTGHQTWADQTLMIKFGKADK